MSIEKDLKQTKPFKTEYERALVNLFFTSKHAESKLQSEYKENGMTMKQYNILRILKGAQKPLSTQLIRERMIDRMSDISRIVDRLIDKNLVSKCTSSADKRLVDISLTEQGLQQVDSLSKAMNSNDHVLHHLSKKEAKLLNILLDKIRGHKVQGLTKETYLTNK